MGSSVSTDDTNLSILNRSSADKQRPVSTRRSSSRTKSARRTSSRSRSTRRTDSTTSTNSSIPTPHTKYVIYNMSDGKESTYHRNASGSLFDHSRPTSRTTTDKREKRNDKPVAKAKKQINDDDSWELDNISQSLPEIMDHSLSPMSMSDFRSISSTSTILNDGRVSVMRVKRKDKPPEDGNKCIKEVPSGQLHNILERSESNLRSCVSDNDTFSQLGSESRVATAASNSGRVSVMRIKRKDKPVDGQNKQIENISAAQSDDPSHSITEIKN
ncbi:unnamed protein product [Didymodactylos carnosus]|uniref:Uncharacterized protein n=1 Tax=Didymodactylos carnosus TaxID=1234261 RepID=A0A8S2DL85_9BILA|nr:unnamed protein product [Didymodactylos carnosus]CAF3728091.1 unnamed protein product [Didymodactylos carnosus]